MSPFLVRTKERRSIRRAHSIACQVVRESDFNLVGETALDVSPDGMLIKLRQGVEVGDKLIVSFQATPMGIWFDSEATVRRIVHGRRPTDTMPAFGISLDSLSNVHRHIMKGYLRNIPPPIPKRTQRIDFIATIKRSLAAAA